MLYVIAAVFLLMWALGLLSTYTMTGFIFVLAVVAAVILLLRLIGKRRVF